MKGMKNLKGEPSRERHRQFSAFLQGTRSVARRIEAQRGRNHYIKQRRKLHHEGHEGYETKNKIVFRRGAETQRKDSTRTRSTTCCLAKARRTQREEGKARASFSMKDANEG